MTIQDLISELQDMAEQYGEETEVRLAQQPQWPFEYSISNIVAVNINEPDEDEEEAEYDDDTEMIVYISEGSQLGYLPGVASRALGWR